MLGGQHDFDGEGVILLQGLHDRRHFDGLRSRAHDG